MPNYIKALIFILVATSVVIFFIRDPFTSRYSKEEYKEYRNTWWFLTACLFLAPGIWIFYAIIILMLLKKRYAADIDRVSAYCFLLFTAPSIEVAIPGVGGIDKLIEIDLSRILILFVLLPLFKKSLSGGWSKNPSDKYLLMYVVLSSILLYRGDNFTHATRLAVLNFVDVIIPYYVISRTIKSVEDFNRVVLALVFTLSMLAAEAVFEAVRHWELYNSTGHRLIGERIHRFSGERAGLLRARSIFLSPIILGLAMVFLLALLLYIKPLFKRKFGYYALSGIAAVALVVSFSRAAWVAGVMCLVLYWLLSSGIARATGYIIMGTVVGSLFMTMTSIGQSLLNLLPFFGGTERADTFDYREKLLENGIIVIKRNPILGNHNYLQTPEMQEMRQGQGIIDTVNVYLTLAMYKGLVGLFLFIMIFLPSVWMIYKYNKKLPDSERRLAQLGRTLLSFMVPTLFMIFTVSNTDFIPIIYYLGAALMAAWVGVYRNYESRANVSTEVRVRPPPRAQTSQI